MMSAESRAHVEFHLNNVQNAMSAGLSRHSGDDGLAN